MKIEEQVASLELCKKLKELGVRQESYFWWDLEDTKLVQSNDFSVPRLTREGGRGKTRGIGPFQEPDYKRFSSALTVAELFSLCWDYGIEYQISEEFKAEELANHLANRIIKERERENSATED